jgi:transposase
MDKINLKEKEVEYLHDFLKKGRKSARELARAHILLFTHEGKTEMEIKDTLRISRATVSNTKKRYREEGLQNALTEKPRSGQPKKYTNKQEAEIIAMACTDPPKGRKRWTIRLLTERMKRRKGFETINRETIRLTLKKAKLSLG